MQLTRTCFFAAVSAFLVINPHRRATLDWSVCNTLLKWKSYSIMLSTTTIKKHVIRVREIIYTPSSHWTCTLSNAFGLRMLTRKLFISEEDSWHCLCSEYFASLLPTPLYGPTFSCSVVTRMWYNSLEFKTKIRCSRNTLFPTLWCVCLLWATTSVCDRFDFLMVTIGAFRYQRTENEWIFNRIVTPKLCIFRQYFASIMKV